MVCWVPFFPSLLSIGASRGAHRRGTRPYGPARERLQARHCSTCALACEIERPTHGSLKLYGEENRVCLLRASNYANLLIDLKRFEEAKSLMRKTIPVARRVLGENDEDTLRLRCIYARALYDDPAAPLDDLREAVTTYEDAGRIARRVFGGSHPLVELMQDDLGRARAALHAREAPLAAEKLAQELSELAKTLADASARPSKGA